MVANAVIEQDKVVSFHYRLFDNANEEVLDTSREPLEFIVGKKNILPGLEEELLGLSAGDEKDILIAPKDAYGEYDQKATEEVARDQFSDLALKEGMTIYSHDDNQKTKPVVVKSFDDKMVVIDYNHPLAGKTLKFFVSIAGIRDASSQELVDGTPAKPESSGGGCCGGGCGCG